MRRLPFPPPATRRVAAAWPAAVAGTIALSLAGEGAAHAAPPAPPLSALPTTPVKALPALAATTGMSTYTVQPGDTVWAIARANGLDVAAVQAANGLTADSVIQPGQVLLLGGTPAATAPTAPAPAAPAPAPAPVTHEVQPGDTVSAIASAHGVSLDAVLSANGLTRGSIIYPGDVLQIPSGSSAAAPAAAASEAAPLTAPGLDVEQSDNARLIIRIGRELGVSDHGIRIALGTAMQESWLRNIDWGDRDSLGLFQQRPSMGWGTPEQILDRERSTRVFYGGPSDPNGWQTRGLLDIPGWEQMPYADAAQAVQISAYPDRYAQWEQPATTWLEVLG
ncbi:MULTISPECIES: LysM domain-containing protein [Microbacterium]|uniref:LysM peptidoglycan-binding domain-containing protein n=1 Tax=Microbacterium TaxID=33882 RepID=UPI002784DE4C|nr:MULTISPECIES: LysM domain-containing protein [Microbacterium]MDQ1083619.1 LysM repeat protein [Microbacterium sp. SORGH_AS_0344]MDQ1171105.1 LysM repeat protein [Microbacterium proteolyticum]